MVNADQDQVTEQLRSFKPNLVYFSAGAADATEAALLNPFALSTAAPGSPVQSMALVVLHMAADMNRVLRPECSQMLTATEGSLHSWSSWLAASWTQSSPTAHWPRIQVCVYLCVGLLSAELAELDEILPADRRLQSQAAPANCWL